MPHGTQRTRITLRPTINLIKNIGLEGISTHLFLKDSFRDELKLSEMKFPLIHPTMGVNQNLDRQTYDNMLSKSYKRIWRLFKENNFWELCSYFMKRIWK